MCCSIIWPAALQLNANDQMIMKRGHVSPGSKFYASKQKRKKDNEKQNERAVGKREGERAQREEESFSGGRERKGRGEARGSRSEEREERQ